MPRKPFGWLFEIASKSNAGSIVLISNTFIWYFVILNTLKSVFESSPIGFWVMFVHFVAIILSAFAGTFVAKYMEKTRFIVVWLILGVGVSLVLFALGSLSGVLVGCVSLFLGVALGFGMPVCMGYFTDGGSIGSRGRVGGVTLLVSGIGIVAFGFFEIGNLFVIGVILGIWRVLGLLAFLWAGNLRTTTKKEKTISYGELIKKRSFIFYFLPWIMFSCVNYLAAPMGSSFSEEYPILTVVQFLSMGVAAILGGIFVDSIGRKPVAIAGFAMLGSGTAVVGFFGATGIILYFNALIDGVAWGFLLVLFIMTLWGDLSHNCSSEKYYALGVMPFFFSMLLEITIWPFISESIISFSALFSLAAFFLFLAVLPLAFAPETLPEKVRKEKELNFYVEKAQEIAQKYY